MPDGDKRLNIVLFQFPEDVPVKLQPLPIGFFFHSCGIDTRPVD